MNKIKLIAVLLGTLLSTAAFAQQSRLEYIITGGENTFPVEKEDGTQVGMVPGESISGAIRAITDDALSRPVSIQFGKGNTLNIGSAMIGFGGASPSFPLRDIVLKGKVTSAPPGSVTGTALATVIIQGGASVTSTGDITSTGAGPAISIQGGEVKISGGKVAKDTGGGSYRCAVEIPFQEEQQGTLTLDWPKITGEICAIPGAVTVLARDNLPIELYTLRFLGGLKDGDVAVIDGAQHIDNFTLANDGFILAKSGNNLVAVTASPSSSSGSIVEPPSSSSATPSSSSAGGSSSSVTPSSSSAGGSSSSVTPSSSSAGEASSSSSETTPIAHYPTPAVNSEVPAYYNIKGEPVGSAKPVIPGVYLVKQGNSIRKIVVR